MSGGLVSPADYFARRRRRPTGGCRAADCPTPADGAHDHPPGKGTTVTLDFADPASRTMAAVRAEAPTRR